MNLHKPTGNPIIGLALGLVTAVIWGTLPVLLKILVRWLDVYTITWFRFFVAGLLLLPLAARSGGIRYIGTLRGFTWVMLGLSVVGLTGNYLTFMGGLVFISPGTAQIVIQLSPVFMVLGGLLLFGESFNPLQWLGLAVLLSGLVLFFSPRFDQLVAALDTQGTGVLLVAAAAMLWGIYMVTQKQLLQYLRAEVILVVIYLGGAALLIPWVQLQTLFVLPVFGGLLLLASSVMTMGSYWTFALALQHVEASRIGLLVSLTPVFVVLNMELLLWWRPGLLEPENLSMASIGGALLVVAGSALGALGRSSTQIGATNQE